MRFILIIGLLCVVQADSQFWDYLQDFSQGWMRQAKAGLNRETTIYPDSIAVTTRAPPRTTKNSLQKLLSTSTNQINETQTENRLTKVRNFTNAGSKTTQTLSINFTTQIPRNTARSSGNTGVISTESSTFFESTTMDITDSTDEPRENSRTHAFFTNKKESPQVKITTNISQNLLPLLEGASAALVKPTKYHYYPHNQHIYLLPECAIQQVCNAVYVRLNSTQPLCACPSRYRDPCSASLNSDDQHTTELIIDRTSKRALTLVKTCEPTAEMRICRSPRDWSLLALQNVRTGKSHYLVICRCPDPNILEGPMSHDQPTYASVPGIRVYGMMCVDVKRKGRPLRTSRSLLISPYSWKKAMDLAMSASWD